MHTRALLAFLAFVSLGLPDGLLGVAWPSIRSDFGLPLDALGLLVAFTTAGYLVSSFLTGRILQLISIGGLLALSTAAAATQQTYRAAIDNVISIDVPGGGIDDALHARAAIEANASAILTRNTKHFVRLGGDVASLVQEP